MDGKILVVGYDTSLLETRATILNKRWQAQIAFPKDVFDILRREPHDVVVLCHSMTLRESAALLQGIRKDFPAVRVLALESTPGSAATLAPCARAVSIDGPEQMFEAISGLLASRHRRVA